METRDRRDARARLERAQGQSSGRSARAQARALASAPVRRRCRAWPRTPLPGAVRSGGIHGLGPGACGVEEFQRQRPRARRATGSRGQDGAGDPRFPRLLHGARRQPVRELERDRPLRRLSDARARAVRRSRVPHPRLARAPGLLRQVLRRLRRDASRHEVRVDLGRDRGPFGRRVFRLRLLARLAQHAERAGEVPREKTKAGTLRRAARREGRRARPGRRAREAVPRRSVEEAQAVGGRGTLHHEPVHGGHLRPRSCGAQRLSSAVQPRDGRSASGALAAVAAARPGAARRALPAQPQVAARHLHRLRLARPVSHPLRLAHPLAAPARGGHRAHLSGIRRRSFRHLLPDGRVASLPLPRAEALTLTPLWRRRSVARTKQQGFSGEGATMPVSAQRVAAVLLSVSCFSPFAAFAAGVEVLSVFPSDRFTVFDRTQNTWRRVNLAKPDCTLNVIRCQDIDVLNTLDGFNIQPRLSIAFSGPVDVSSVHSDSVFLVSLGSTLGRGSFGDKVGINQIVWDPQTNTLHAESDELLEQHTRYALIVTDRVRDAQGKPVQARQFSTRNHGGDDDAVMEQTARRHGRARIVAASLFTTQTITATLEKIRDQIKASHPAPARFDVGSAGERAVFALSSLASASFVRQVGTAPAFQSSPLPLAALGVRPGAGTLAFGSYVSPNYLAP